MTEHDLSDQPATDGKPATEAPVVAAAGETFDELDSTTPLSVASQEGSEQSGSAGSPDSGAS